MPHLPEWHANAMRTQIINEDWRIDRTNGIEAVVNRELGIRIAYQNVDRACSVHCKPRPLSAKGAGSENLCGVTLFEWAGVNLEPPICVLADGLATYYVMVAVDGGIELSRPIIKNKTFHDFHERIFVCDPKEPWEGEIEAEDGPVDDFDIKVALKDEA